jgi:hypothetical protein
MRKLSIVIPSMNVDLLINCMNSILNYTVIKDIEFVFVLHGDPNYEKIYPYVNNISNYDKLIKILWYRKVIDNPHLEGIKQASGQYIMILKDSFVAINYNWINSDYFV